MLQRAMLCIPRWSAALLAVWLLLPVALQAQDLLPWQTIVHNGGNLFFDAGRTRVKTPKNMHEYWYYVHPGTEQWTLHEGASVAMSFHMPVDEWAPLYMGMQTQAGGVESVLGPEWTNPRSYENITWGGCTTPNDLEAFYKARRWRPPVVLVGDFETSIGMTEQYEIDPNLPTNQAGYIVNQMWPDQDGLCKSRTVFALENKNLDRSVFWYEKEWHRGIWTRVGGSTGDSVETLPAGQVLTAWEGYRWIAEHNRSVLMWQGAGHNTSLQTRQDDYGVVIEHASRYLTPADAPRAARLQLAVIKDGYSDDLNDWDGTRFDDTGNPYIGPQFTRGDVTRETGEFIGDGIAGAGYIYFARGDGAHDSDWFNPADPLDGPPNNIFWSRRVLANNATDPEFGGVAGYWNRIKTPHIQRGSGLDGQGQIASHFEGLGANVSGIEWTGVTSNMVETQPPVTNADKQNAYLWCFMTGGPIILQPGDTHERMRIMLAADLPNKECISLGQRYLKWLAQQKQGVHPNGNALPSSVVPLSNLEKWQVLEGIKDSIFAQYDRAFTAFHGGPGSGLTNAQKLAGEGLRRYPDPPPPADIYVNSGPGRCEVFAWYPDDAMFEDADTGVDDFRGWRVYRKQGDPWVNTSEEIATRGYRDWELVAELRADGVFNIAGQSIPGAALAADHYNRDYTFRSGEIRRVMYFGDVNVVRGEPYYYAVCAIDNGSQNTRGFHPGEMLEGSRYTSSTAMGGVGIQVTAYTPGVSPQTGLTLSAAKSVAGLGATIFALSQDALFDLNIGRGVTRAVPVTVSAASTAGNVTIDHLVSDIQSAVDAAVGTGKVTVGNTSIGKAAAPEATTYTLTFSSVEQNVVLAISGVNSVTNNELGIIGGQVGRFVVVSPNPWALDLGAGLSSDQNQIFFDNLPPYATLKIFTETGDLVRTIRHDNGSAQETWFQVNQNNQLVKSGLYILAVVNAKDFDFTTGLPGVDLPDQFVKFVIIR